MKKRIITIFALLFALTTCAVPSISAHAADSEFITIGLKYQSSDSTAELSASEGLKMCTKGSNSIEAASDVLDGVGDIVLTLTNGEIVVTDKKGNELTTLTGDGTECITSADYFSTDDYISYDGTSYRGGIIPYINSSGQMNILNYVDMDDYIKGVLHKEMSQSSNLEALKAQAVTARSFAEYKKNTHSSQGFDLCATSHCQNYIGVKGEYTSTNEAVESTSGEMIYYEGEPVAGYYFANSGGHTENSEDVWTAKLGYLRGIKDEYSPEYTWTETFTREELTNIFSSQGLGTVTSVKVDSYNDSGYAASLTVTGTDKSVTYTKDKIRSAFSGTSLKSRMFTLDTNGGTLTGSNGETISSSDNSVIYAITSKGKEVLGNVLSVLSLEGESSINLDGLKILDGSGNITTVSAAETSEPTTVTFSSDSDTLIINGRGNGHGVGMSQQGAIEMGEQGFSYTDILNYYYTDIEVK
ncbi:MAG: SpoIID/LytB domain-containing protein [Anaerovoracaceae bacterium]|jgi:stage II sporulation protein D